MTNAKIKDEPLIRRRRAAFLASGMSDEIPYFLLPLTPTQDCSQ